MSISKDTIVDALRLRYDAYSAETIFELACQRAELEGKTTFEGRDLTAFRGALEKVGDRVGGVLARLDELAGNPPPPSQPAKQEAKPEPEQQKAKEPEQQKAKDSDGKKGKGDKPSDAKPEAKSDAKTDAKPEAKSDKDAKTGGTEAKSADKSGGSDAKPVETTIVLRGLEVADGEQVMLCGELTDLGDWDPERARPMVRKGDEWLTTLELEPDTEVKFKFLRRNAAGKVTWEAGDNRQVRANQRLDATWRTEAPAS
ncbi:MAG TPA: carbohydrate-binding module family 20 domain-containing protein [Kofleriaceae bacterium]|nr:carbohydrate-binding module family 20 domain-containing protein [Kofleriaceae bacterium]